MSQLGGERLYGKADAEIPLLHNTKTYNESQFSDNTQSDTRKRQEDNEPFRVKPPHADVC